MDCGTDKKTDSHPLDNGETLTIIQNKAYVRRLLDNADL